MIIRDMARGGMAERPGSGMPCVPAVFVSPHQDDELLFMGAAIMEHVAQGRDVRILLIGRGNKSSVRTSSALLNLIGYVPSEPEFGAVRDREFQWSAITLGATPIVPPWDMRLDENAFTSPAVASIIRHYVPDGSDLKTVSRYGGEYHPDHFACHDAVAGLFASGWTAMPPRYYTLAERRQVALDAGVSVRREGVAHPVGPLNQWAYRLENVAQRRWGVGYKSVRSYFNSQAVDPFSYRVCEPQKTLAALSSIQSFAPTSLYART